MIVSPQTVQVKGENGNLVITPDGNVMYNGKQYSLNAAQREQAKDYQAELRSTLPWIDEGAKSRVEKARIALDKNYRSGDGRKQQNAQPSDQT
ncbi:protein [Escherichia coli]|uniref:Protein n=1 Tax=Escherichia coli TaxID=562 RepID=A0A377D9D6_ECOLX|nr:protein [Escherichia coli]